MKKKTHSERSEGRCRQAAAEYFLAAPPFWQQSVQEQKRTARVLACLRKWEMKSILQTAGSNRPLFRGDVIDAVRETAEACAILLAARGTPVQIDIGGVQRITAFAPRILELTIPLMLRAAGMGGAIRFTLSEGARAVTLSVHAAHPIRQPSVLALIQETARLHRGSVAVLGGTTAFSIKIIRGGHPLPFPLPSAEELVQNSLSGVCVGLLSSGSVSGCFFPEDEVSRSCRSHSSFPSSDEKSKV